MLTPTMIDAINQDGYRWSSDLSTDYNCVTIYNYMDMYVAHVYVVIYKHTDERKYVRVK